MTQGKLTRTFVNSASNEEKTGNTTYFLKAKLARADPDGDDRALTTYVITMTTYLQSTKRLEVYMKVMAFVTFNDTITKKASQIDVRKKAVQKHRR